MSIAPALTTLDRRVLAMLHRPRRVAYIAATTRESEREIVLILRGLEHLGRARNSNGWWSAT